MAGFLATMRGVNALSAGPDMSNAWRLNLSLKRQSHLLNAILHGSLRGRVFRLPEAKAVAKMAQRAMRAVSLTILRRLVLLVEWELDDTVYLELLGWVNVSPICSCAGN